MSTCMRAVESTRTHDGKARGSEEPSAGGSESIVTLFRGIFTGEELGTANGEELPSAVDTRACKVASAAYSIQLRVWQQFLSVDYSPPHVLHIAGELGCQLREVCLRGTTLEVRWSSTAPILGRPVYFDILEIGRWEIDWRRRRPSFGLSSRQYQLTSTKPSSTPWASSGILEDINQTTAYIPYQEQGKKHRLASENGYRPNCIPDAQRDHGYELCLEAYRAAWLKCPTGIQDLTRALHAPVIDKVSESINKSHIDILPGLLYAELPVISVSSEETCQ
ncbi:hypothetical protein EDD15DRAFT_2479442 [Pisolithus albus]|nr:hypothetical protein EDD15DRAFT_2374947 [Pisolithus albus]KAI5984721.1 hypothetical protein EDD15DRAFT_2479442 [Pisolithus albus]